MILDRKDIEQLIRDRTLIHDHDPNKITNCAYTLRVGAVFEPQTGTKHLVPPKPNNGGEALHWTIGPAECWIIKTRESLNMPHNICGHYSPLYRLARQGVMLINASLIEPNYSGPLSCYLVNFSSNNVEISINEEIAKITFYRVDNATQGTVETLDLAAYENKLASSAKRFARSFLGVGDIEERAAKRASETVKHSVIGGSIVVGLLVLFAQAEPLFSRWLWEKTGVISATQRAEEVKLLKELELAHQQLKSSNDEHRIDSTLASISKQLQSLSDRLEKMENASDRTPTRRQ